MYLRALAAPCRRVKRARILKAHTRAPCDAISCAAPCAQAAQGERKRFCERKIRRRAAAAQQPRAPAPPPPPTVVLYMERVQVGALKPCTLNGFGFMETLHPERVRVYGLPARPQPCSV